MTPQELKSSILQMAIQGKLVEQRPEEGTGEELYWQIQAEKQKLIQAGKIKKEKPLPEISEAEIPFDIPGNWKWVCFGNCITLLSGTDFKPEEYNNQCRGVPYITGASSLTDTGVILNRWTEVPRVLANLGDVLLICKGSGYGKTVICDIQEAHIARQIMAVKKNPFLNMEYIRYYLNANFELIKSKGQGVIPGIDRNSVLCLPLPLPPIAEQKRIVAKIEKLLPYIDRYEKAWSRLEDFNHRFPVDMQKSILQMAMQGKLVEQRPEEGTGEELYQQIQTEKQKLIKAGKIKKEKPLPEISEDEIPFELPVEWKWIRMGDIINSITAGKSLKCYETVPNNNQAGIIKVSAVTWGNFQENESKTCFSEDCWVEEYAIHRGDILISRANTQKLVGACVIVQDISKRLMLSDKILRLSCSSLILPQYMIYCLRSPAIRAQIETSATGTSESMKNISQNNIKQYVFPLPPLAEQKRIVAKLEEILPLCERLK